MTFNSNTGNSTFNIPLSSLHPDLHPIVNMYRSLGGAVPVFPALLRAQYATPELFVDLLEIHVDQCDACSARGSSCEATNLSTWRCLSCFNQDTVECSWYTKIKAKGYEDHPICFEYDEARSKNILAIPSGVEWPHTTTLSSTTSNDTLTNHTTIANELLRPNSPWLTWRTETGHRDWRAIADSTDFHHALSCLSPSTHALVFEAMEALIKGTEIIERATSVLKGPVDNDDNHSQPDDNNDATDDEDDIMFFTA
ncbi:hypothetical protein C8Q76DRAFT_796730 [Earliella scabrosa]|nr:hypothetical protein C8Q76DRAFT_796730 [Earliella scabrosa]